MNDTLKVGIGVINYNRSELLNSLLKDLLSTTDENCRIVVADDGSQDNSVDICEKHSIPYVTGKNKGIAWNKNRALYYLMNHTNSDIIILIENDCKILTPEWIKIWKNAVDKHGHINCLHPSTLEKINDGIIPEEIVGGSGSIDDPYICGKISGICIGSTRKLINQVGYLDTRFEGYGHEHSEWTLRFRRTDHGFLSVNGTKYNLMISGGITAHNVPSSSNKEKIEENRKIMDECKRDSLYRYPWRNIEQEACLKEEIMMCVDRSAQYNITKSLTK